MSNKLMTLKMAIDESLNNKCKISKPNFMRFILGDLCDEYTDTHLSNLYNLVIENKNKEGCYLTNDISDKIINSKTRDFTRLNRLCNFALNKEKFSSELKEKLKCEFDNNSGNPIGDELTKIIFKYFFNSTDIRYRFTEQYPLAKLYKNYQSCEPLEQEVINMVTNNKISFIIGNPGSGKTLLLNSVLRDIYANLKFPLCPDVCLIPYKDIPLNDYLDITFSYKENLKTHNKGIDYLNKKDNNSLLIIERPRITNEDFEFIENELNKLDTTKIIIVTCNKNIPSAFKRVDIDQRPLDNLIKLFNAHCNITLDNSFNYAQLFSTVGYNTLGVILLANTLNNKKRNIFDITKTENPLWIWQEKNLPPIHSSYHESSNNSSYSIRTMICRILETYELDNSTYDILSELSIWCRHPLNIYVLKQYFSDTDIAEILSYGILQYSDSDENVVFMPGLIADAIWNMYPIEFRDYINRIMELQNLIEFGNHTILSVSDIINLINNMIRRFHFQVTDIKYDFKTEAKTDFNTWNDLLIKCIQYFIKLGNYSEAFEILSYIFDYTQKSAKNADRNIVSEEKFLIRQLMHIQIKYATTSNIPCEIDNIIKIIKQIELVTNKSKDKIKNNSFKLCKNYISFVLKDILDHALRVNRRLEFTSLIEKIGYKDSYNSRLLLLIPNMCNLFIELSLEDTLREYYLMNYYYIMSINFERFNNIDIATDIKNGLFKNLHNNDDLHMKTQCISFYYTLVMIYSDAYIKKANIPHVFIKVLEDNYENLHNNMSGKLYTWETKWIFHTCSILFFSFSHLLSEKTVSLIQKHITEIDNFCSTQIYIPDSDLSIIKSMLKNIQKAML